VLNIQSDSVISLEVQRCDEDQQNNADEFLLKTSGAKDKSDTAIKSKGAESIGFTINNAKGKHVQSIGSEDVKIIKGITKLQSKHTESYAFKDKKTLKKELESWFDDDDEKIG
jgi:hypothetical protein